VPLLVRDADYTDNALLPTGRRLPEQLLRRGMSELEQDLDPAVFCRVHRSTIVNLDRVRGLKLGEDGEYTVQLEGGICLRLSRRYRKQVTVSPAHSHFRLLP
jgi:two-component system LytT family response regulator